MQSEEASDVPSPIDLRDMRDARDWAATVSAKRPFRAEFFGVFARELSEYPSAEPKVLELGSGPGFLAQALLHARVDALYTALDFSAAMHDLARERLGPQSARVMFQLADFRTPDWTTGIGNFDVVVTMQAVHELRHKRRAAGLYRQVLEILQDSGTFLVCDHFHGPDAMSNADLYMTPEEHAATLGAAGFPEVSCLLNKGGMVLYQARKGKI